LALLPDPGGAAAAIPAARLGVVRLALTDFRSYAQAELVVGGAPVVLAGPNGAGKTNVLDAISLLAPGRGLRGAKLAEHTRRGPSAQPSGALWAIAATIARDGEEFDIGTGLIPGPGGGARGGERRQVRLGGAPAQSSADLGEIVQMTWLTPAMDRLFVEGASGRRRFLDRLTVGFDAGHARAAQRYETAMRERARLLKYGPRDPAWLDALEAEMADAGWMLAEARAKAVEKLNAMLEKRRDAGAFPAARLGLEGETDLMIAEMGMAAEAEIRTRLAALRVRDAESGRTSFGPHVSDLTARHMVKRADAKLCSTGEQKALLISIILADAWEMAAEKDRPPPILLLDEIAAHLDAARREALFEEILALGAQAWITGTDLALFDALVPRAEVFSVENGVFVRRS
jgi:DNA replication and repair protein RecF